MSNDSNRFIEWLDEQEKKNGFSDYEVAKQGGFSHSVLSRARSGIPPKWDVCGKIAKVFNVSPITVIRKAGLLPAGSENVAFEDWLHLLDQLSPDDQEEMRQVALLKIERSKKAQGLKNLKTKRVG
jgi:transcriptional regulator with XRE-family HTH domain